LMIQQGGCCHHLQRRPRTDTITVRHKTFGVGPPHINLPNAVRTVKNAPVIVEKSKEWGEGGPDKGDLSWMGSCSFISWPICLQTTVTVLDNMPYRSTVDARGTAQWIVGSRRCSGSVVVAVWNDEHVPSLSPFASKHSGRILPIICFQTQLGSLKAAQRLRRNQQNGSAGDGSRGWSILDGLKLAGFWADLFANREGGTSRRALSIDVRDHGIGVVDPPQSTIWWRCCCCLQW
jgi:hypothetical protein